MKPTIMVKIQMVYLDLCDSRGYTNELDKPTQNYSKMTITIQLKNALAKKHAA